ncbi:tetratricopeptide repeat protein [Flavobacterium sp. TAB 87]|uniref:tetratricopeptide repeat protein n=1 Tax=Flavobacterium sp. TAB 87 TaxID=1729581 RepID=UPI00076D373B|nr:tetratricopeptide repeat protein [Flavobacterium sp. TAB 87]KVV13283.1 putative O-linked N-acetylglucosamine transferase, SPINDLY family [Flavobacterium sp. TAB 87]
MKNILFLFLFITQVLFAQSSFEKANDLYTNLKYQEAASAYEDILKTEKLQSADLYFNLGNCYYKLNQVAPSIYNYEKALFLRPNDAAALNNLKFAKKLTIDEIKDVPKVGFAKLVQNFTGIFTYNTWAWICVALSFCFLFCFIGYYLSQLTLAKRLYFTGMFLLIFVLLLSFSAAISEKHFFNNNRPAIVFAEITEIHSEPQKGASVIVVLHEGAKLYVKETLNSWKKIELTDGTEGWIEASAIIEVKRE